jgi:hypothetical protein
MIRARSFLTLGLEHDRYPYLDLSPEDIVPPDAPEVPMGPFIVRCENDHMHVDAVFGVLSHNK